MELYKTIRNLSLALGFSLLPYACSECGYSGNTAEARETSAKIEASERAETNSALEITLE